MSTPAYKIKAEGILFVLAASLIWAIESILVKYLYKHGSTVLETATVRAIIASFVAFAYLVFKRARVIPTKSEFISVSYIALAASLLADTLFLFGVTKTNIVNALLIAHTQPIFIVLLGLFFLHDKLTRFDYMGGFLMIMAGIMVSSARLENLLSLRLGNFGDLLVLLASFAWATTAVVARKHLTKSESALVTAYRFGICGLFLFAILLFRSGIFAPALLQVCLGVVIGVGYIFYMEGIKRIKAAQVSSLELSSILFGAVFGYLIFAEKVTSLQLTGIIVMLAGVYLISKKENVG